MNERRVRRCLGRVGSLGSWDRVSNASESQQPIRKKQTPVTPDETATKQRQARARGRLIAPDEVTGLDLSGPPFLPLPTISSSSS